MESLLNRQEERRALRLARTQPESAGELQEFLAELTERCVERVHADERVRARLHGIRHEVVAAGYGSTVKHANNGGEVLGRGEICIYDYHRDVLVVAVVDLRDGTVLEVVERQGVRPPIAAAEIEAAKTIASSDPRIASLLSRGDINIVAFPTPAYLETHARARHRCATLHLSSDHQKLGEVTVDLSEQQIVSQEELTAASPRIAVASL